MKKLYNPRLLWVSAMVPQTIIFILYYRIYGIISSEFSKENINNWILFSVLFGVAFLATSIYSIILWKKKRNISPYGAVAITTAYVSILIFFAYRFNVMMPVNIQSWMLFGIRPGMAVLTLTMPVLAHLGILIIHWSVENSKLEKPYSDGVIIFTIPILCYLLITTVASEHRIAPILFIIGTIVFIFSLIRIVYRKIKDKEFKNQPYIVPLLLIGSLAGLSLNASIGNVFGDFTHFAFYFLDIITCGLLLLPQVEDVKLRTAIFAAKSITFVFTLYFFVVFLPLMPLSLLGIIVFGLGLLILVPTLLMMIHCRSLWVDFCYLRGNIKIQNIIAVFLVSIMVLPGAIVYIMSKDEGALDEALSYTYQRDFDDDKEYKLNIKGIERTLNNIKYVKGNDRSGEDFLSRNTDIPYITAIYNNVVLEGLTISNKKINLLERTFFGESSQVLVEDETSNEDIEITKINTETIYESREETYTSWIHFEIKNTWQWQNEYSTVFTLPDNAYISDYYLYVGDEKKYGMLADKRAANWIYNQIKTVRKDPGLLTYIPGNKISFKIFPFSKNETRKSGIKIVHKRPLKMYIDGKNLTLDSKDINSDAAKSKVDVEDLKSRVKIVPKEVKEKLPLVSRDLKYYFLIDASKASKDKIQDYAERLEKYIEENKIEKTSIKQIYAINYSENNLNLHSWKEDIKDVKPTGGLFLDYTLKKLLYKNYMTSSNEYPVIITVSDEISKSIVHENIEDLGFLSPEGLFIYKLNSEGNLEKYNLPIISEYSATQEKRPQPLKVIKYTDEEGKITYLPNDHRDSIVIKDVELTEGSIENTSFENGAALKGAYLYSALHPENYLENNLIQVKNSILSNVMSPLTSFMVLETKAQEKVLIEKQKQILSAKKAIDVGDVTEMDEPAMVIVLLFICLLYILKKRFFKHVSKLHNYRY